MKEGSINENGNKEDCAMPEIPCAIKGKGDKEKEVQQAQMKKKKERRDSGKEKRGLAWWRKVESRGMGK